MATGEDDLTIRGPGAPRPAAPAAEVGEASAPAATAATGAIEGSDVALAEALRAGSIDAAQAQALLVDQVVRAQLGPDASPELVERVRAEIEQLLADDPVLADLLRV
jgi:hypothetical protein